MKKIKVNYLKNFIEDKRHSMIVHANDLIDYQKKVSKITLKQLKK